MRAVNRGIAMIMVAIGVATSLTLAQDRPRARRSLTRPPADNERGLRELTEEEIPPNLNFYAMDPLYDPNAVLGWAQRRIEEKLDRAMVALSMGEDKVYLGWRLLKTDPKTIAFNVYRSTAGGAPVRLNAEPVSRTTDFVDTSAPAGSTNAWWVRPVADGREQDACIRVELPAGAVPIAAPTSTMATTARRDGSSGVSTWAGT